MRLILALLTFSTCLYAERVFVVNLADANALDGSGGPDSLLTFEMNGKNKVLVGVDRNMHGAGEVACGPTGIALALAHYDYKVNELDAIDPRGQKTASYPDMGTSDLAYDKQGNFYLGMDSTVYRNGQILAQLPQGQVLRDLAVDTNGNVYLTTYAGKYAPMVLRIDPTGRIATLADGIPGVDGIAVNSKSQVFVSTSMGNEAGQIWEFEPNGQRTLFAPSIGFQPRIDSMAFDHEDHLFIVLGSHNKILRFTEDGEFTIFADENDGINAPWGIAIGDCPIQGPLFSTVNKQVSLTAKDTQLSLDTSQCPAGFYGGIYSLMGVLTNKGQPMTEATVQVISLTKGNVLQNADSKPSGAGALLSTHQSLNTNESMEIPLRICLKNTLLPPQFSSHNRFSFLVNVLGIQ